MYSLILTPWPYYYDCTAFPWKQDLSIRERGPYDGGNQEKKMIQWPSNPFLISDVLKLWTLLSRPHATHMFTSKVRKT